VVDAIRSGPTGKIDVALLVWAGPRTHSENSGWFQIGSEVDAETFAAYVESFPRRVNGSTSVGNALMSALALLRDPALQASRRCIDLSGDGKETITRHYSSLTTVPIAARRTAEDLRVTINALAMQTDERELARWYRRHVVTKDGFVVAINTSEEFSDAIQKK
jgi:Ca-activated chloride channel homolog